MIKKKDVTYIKMFKKEVSISKSLNYLNLITYYFVITGSANGSIESFGIKEKKEHLYIEMELMQKNLNSILVEKKRCLIYFFTNIILQIVKMMYYLYDMYIALGDLKLDNILVNVIEIKILNKIK